MIIASFCFFIILMIIVGNIASWRKKQHTAEDYLVAGRSYGKFTIALSTAASAVSGFIMIGAVGAGYTLGLKAILMPLGWFFGDLVFWTLFPDRINRRARNSNCNTIPEFISEFTSNSKNSVVRKVLAVAIIVFVGLYAVGQFLAAGKAINAVFNIPMTFAIVMSGLIILAYSAKGGLEASIPTQSFQALVMLFTTIGMLLYAIVHYGNPQQIIESLNSTDPGLLSIDGEEGYWSTFIIFVGFSCAAFTFDLGTPHLLVRIMATKSPEEAAKSRWVYIIFMQLTWISMTLFGLLMNLFLPEIADPEQALPVFSQNYLHPILAGAVLAGIFAAVASSLDGQLLVVSSSFAVDVMPKFYERMTTKIGTRYQTIVTVIVAILIGLVAITLQNSTNVFNIIVSSASIMGATIGMAFFITLMRWQSSALALTSALLVAAAVATMWRYHGLSVYLLEAAPSFIAGLLTHQVIISVTKAVPVDISSKSNLNM